jgi:hypothetical protein
LDHLIKLHVEKTEQRLAATVLHSVERSTLHRVGIEDLFEIFTKLLAGSMG